MKNDIVVDTNFLNQCVNNNKQVNQDINKAVTEFQGSYLCTCGDAIISRIGPKLSPLYQSLKSVSNNAASYITKYATDAKNLEEVLSGDMSSGMLNDPTSRTQVNSMPKLKKYRMNEPHYNSINRENRSYINKTTVNQDNTKYNINKNKSNKPSIGGFIKYLWEDAGYGDKVYSFCESVTNLEKNVGKKIMSFAEKANETKAAVEKEAVSIYAKAKSTAKKLSTKQGREEALDSLSQEIEEIKKETTTNVRTIKNKMSTKEGRQEILTEAVKTTVNVINTVHTTKERVKATGATVFTGIAKGVIKTGEDLRDGLEMLGGAIVNGGIAVVDLAGYAIGKTDANNLRSDKFMKKLSDHVKEDYASEMIEDIETNTGYSKIANYEKENAYGYETVNGFSEGIGNVAGTMALSAVGAGVVSKFTKATTAATALDSGVKATKAFTQASTAISFVSGTGRGSQEAYQNGASATSGLIYGLGSGAWEGLQWYTGSKISNYNLTESKIGKKVISKSITAGKKQLINSGARIVLDSVDGAVEGFVQPGLKKIYDKRTYKELYEESGGLQNVIMQGAIGGVMSAGGEVKDIRKAFSKNKNLKVEPLFDKTQVTSNNIDNSIKSEKLYENKKNISIEEIKKMSFLEKQDFLENANIDKINSIFREGNINLDDYSKIIDKKIIKNQDYVTNVCTIMYDENLIKYIQSNQNILENLSDKSLMRLAGKSDNQADFNKIGPVLKEIRNRIDKGNFDIAFSSLENTNLKKFDDYQVAMKLLINSDPEYYTKYLDNLRSKWQNNIPEDIYNKIKNVGFNQKAVISNICSEGRFDENSKAIIDFIYKKNPNDLLKFNFSVLDKEFLNSVGNDFAIEIGSYPQMMDKLMSIKSNNLNAYNKFIDIIKFAQKDVSLNNLYSKTSNVLNFYFNNIEIIDDIAKLPNQFVIDYSFFTKNVSNRYNIDLNQNFFENYYKICDKEFEKNISIAGNYFFDEAKNNYFQKYFSIDITHANELIEKYGTNIDKIIENIDSDEGRNAVEFLQIIKKVYDTDDRKLLSNLYKNNNGGIRLTGAEINYLDEILSNEYSKTYVTKLSETANLINLNTYKTLKIGDKEVKISRLQDEFSLLVYSSDTGYNGNNKLVNDSYIETWNKTGDLRTSALSTSFISNKNIGSAPVGENGVLYGFTNLISKDIKEMGTYDLHSNINDFSYTSMNPQVFITADSMSENTTRGYNEIVLDRRKVKPDYVILYSSSSEKVKLNSYNAASEWDIPIVEINIEELASKQLEKADKLIEEFKINKDVSTLKNALDLYEANANGFKANLMTSGIDTNSNINFDNVKSIFDSKKFESIILEYISELHAEKDLNKSKELEVVFESIISKYLKNNTNGNFGVSKTKPVIDVETLLNILKEGI